MTTTEVIDLFHLYSDNSTELSDAEELALLNRAIRKLALDRPWEELKTEATGAMSGTTIDLPADFGYLTENYQDTDISIGQGESVSKVVWIDNTSYRVVNFSDRKQYRTTSSVCYLDLANSQIVFPVEPSGTTYYFDYIKFPTDLTAGATITWPKASFQPMLAHIMAIDAEIMEKFPRANSYAGDNQAKYQSYLRDMAYINSQYRAE